MRDYGAGRTSHGDVYPQNLKTGEQHQAALAQLVAVVQQSRLGD